MIKKLFPVILLTLFTVTLASAQQTTFKNGAEYCSYKKTHNDKQLSPIESISPIPGHTFDVLNYKLQLDIFNCFTSPYPHTFTASNIMTFKVDSTLNQIKLDAANNSLTIDSVRLAAASFTHSNNKLTINLNQTYNAGDTVTIKIYYRHNNITDGAFNVSGGFVFTDCEPEGARHWFPCWDRPSDKAKLDLTARVPLNVKLGSNGSLMDSTISGGARYYHWVSHDPVATYLMVMSAKVNYNLDIVYWHKISNPNDSIPIRFYYNQGENPHAMEAEIIPMTTYYSQTFCEHPFEKNGFCTLNNLFSWGGMENQTLTNFCPNCWSTSLMAHEFAHQWFGDMITCGTWADIFLNEGFATFIEALWTGHEQGYNAYHNEIVGNASTYLNSNPGWAISVPDWAVNTPSTDVLFNYAVTYMKGSCVMAQLRYVLGDSLFFAGMKAYANNPDLRFHSAIIPDFKNQMETTTGKELDWFFDEWIYTPNHPHYQNWYSYHNMGHGKWMVKFTANQTQTNTGFFQMPVEIKFSFNGKSDTTVHVMNTANHQLFTWIFDARPVGVPQFDPNNNIVLKEASIIQHEDNRMNYAPPLD